MSIEASDSKRRRVKAPTVGTVAAGLVALSALAAAVIVLRIVLVELFPVL
jgi:hypothetical protein